MLLILVNATVMNMPSVMATFLAILAANARMDLLEMVFNVSR